ncbi:MAG: acetylornithine deacetylase, partial [Bacteroidota bacterium]
TVIPEVVTAHLDVRLVEETDGQQQIEKIRQHITDQGFLVLDRAPTDEERLSHRKIVTFESNRSVNAFRTDMNAPIGQKLIAALETSFGEPPVSIRTMGGTVPIIPAVNTLQIPAIIVPMVNMDNNQHNPNENLRVGNMITGIKICMTVLTMDLD